MSHLLNYLPILPLARLDDSDEAGLCITSLPWPRATGKELSLGGLPTYAQPLGQWPDEAPGSPRRLLLIGDSGGKAPADLHLTEPTAPQFAPPTIEMVEFDRSPEPSFMWQRHYLRVSWQGRTVGLALGLRHAGEVHWWEACGLLEVASTPACRVVEMGGAIPREIYGIAALAETPGYANPYLHFHNWLNGHLYLRLHANGVCEVYAHHINSRFFDEGRPLEDVVPVIGFRDFGSQEGATVLCGDWDGQRASFKLGDADFDVEEAARLATPAQPGRIDQEGDFLAWQPYLGYEMFGGIAPLEITGDPYIIHAEQHFFPRGGARTVRFSFSLSDRSPRIARYLAPAWWYGVCEEFLPRPLLPVSNRDDEQIDAVRQWVREGIVRGGFEDGSVPRYHLDPPARHEPGWEGEAPYAQFLGAWRSGEEDDYHCALRSAYHFTDTVIDHTSKLVRMHGNVPGTYAIPMARYQGTIAGYLETGDPYLLDTAQAGVEASYWMNRNSWPRLAVGRDACIARGALLLYRYFADDHFRRYAYETALMAAHTQRPDGSFGDQGGGTGLHAWGGYISKPWMGLLATNGVLDYLEMFPDEQPLLDTVRRFADWLMAERWEHAGGMTWSYQHFYNGERRHFDPNKGLWWELPTESLWHEETIARLMTFCAVRFNKPEYFDAWAASHALLIGKYTDHSANAVLQFTPWLQATLWGAELTPDGIRLRPRHFGHATPREGAVIGQDGPVPVSWVDGHVQAPASISVEL